MPAMSVACGNHVFIMKTKPKYKNPGNCPAIRAWTGVSRAFMQRSAEEKKRRMSLAEKTATICILTISALATLTGCQTQSGEVLPASASGQKPGILASGDTIKVSFTAAPELNQAQRIEPDGNVSLPLVGEIYAAGETPAQLQDKLTGLYKSQLQNSEVIVTLENTVIPVVVSGEVQKPGKIVFERPATVLEAIMEAGGFTAYADPKRVSLIRQVKGDHHAQVVDLSPILKGIPTPAMYVSPGDVIYVRARFISF
jgi:polysaccharide biosynthesis/export protein